MGASGAGCAERAGASASAAGPAGRVADAVIGNAVATVTAKATVPAGAGGTAGATDSSFVTGRGRCADSP